MRSKMIFLTLLALLLLAAPMFAQGTGTAAGGTTNWKPAFAAIGMGIAAGLCGMGQGKAVAGACEAIARNPGATAAIRFALILGLVLIESLAIYMLVINFVTT